MKFILKIALLKGELFVRMEKLTDEEYEQLVHYFIDKKLIDGEVGDYIIWIGIW